MLKDVAEIPETYNECFCVFNLSLKTCDSCALRLHSNCGKIRANIINFYRQDKKYENSRKM